MKIELRSVSAALIILMVGIEAFIQITGLIRGGSEGVNTVRYQMFLNWGLYVGSPIHTYFTYAFIHGSLIHIVMNMFVTTQMGPPCEKMMGKPRYAIFTVIAAIICGYVTYWILTALRGQTNFVLIGFSGVIFAYVGAFFRVNLDRTKDKWSYTKKFFSYNFLLLAFIFVPIFMPSLGISGEAHLVGAVFGFAAGPLFLKKRPRQV